LRVEGNGSLAETIPRYEVTSYFGLARPANLPADAVKRLGAATVAMVKEPQTIERLRVLGSALFRARLRASRSAWRTTSRGGPSL